MFLINRLIRPLIGPLFGLIVLSTSLFGAYIITLLLPLLLFGTAQTWRAVLDRAVSFWMIVPVTLLEHLFGVKFKVTGDSIDMHKPAIVIMNHRTRIDWMYFWVALYKINPWLISTSKIALKEELRKIPGAGFGMAATHFIFMRRQVDEDRRRLTDAIDYYIDMRRNYQILLFPEGTDKSAWTTRKSDEYAKKKGLKQLDYVIYPRVAGFTHLINRMRQRNYIGCIYDVTVAYPINVVQSEIDLVLKSEAPERVHFDIRRIDIAHVPKTDSAIAEWLNRLWVLKDAKLAKYYSMPPLQRQFSSEGEKFVWDEGDEPRHRIAKMFSFWFWMVVVSTYLFHLTFIRLVQMVTLYSVIAAFLMNCLYGGIDKMVHYLWLRSKPNRTRTFSRNL